MPKQLIFFRPGEERRMLARCQFGAVLDSGAGATLTYPLKGVPWRKNPMKHVTFDLTAGMVENLFESAWKIKEITPEECLAADRLWNDVSEKANGITRDRESNTLCYSISIFELGASPDLQFSIRESSQALKNSLLFKTVAELIRPYEAITI
jgi:hypothetical protein